MLLFPAGFFFSLFSETASVTHVVLHGSLLWFFVSLARVVGLLLFLLCSFFFFRWRTLGLDVLVVALLNGVVYLPLRLAEQVVNLLVCLLFFGGCVSALDHATLPELAPHADPHRRPIFHQHTPAWANPSPALHAVLSPKILPPHEDEVPSCESGWPTPGAANSAGEAPLRLYLRVAPPGCLPNALGSSEDVRRPFPARALSQAVAQRGNQPRVPAEDHLGRGVPLDAAHAVHRGARACNALVLLGVGARPSKLLGALLDLFEHTSVPLGVSCLPGTSCVDYFDQDPGALGAVHEVVVDKLPASVHHQHQREASPADPCSNEVPPDNLSARHGVLPVFGLEGHNLLEGDTEADHIQQVPLPVLALRGEDGKAV